MGKIAFGFKKLGKKRSGRLDRQWDFDAQSAIASAPLIADIDGDGKEEIIFGAKNGRLFVLDGEAGIKWFYDSNEQVDDVEVFFLDTESSSSIEAPPSIADINRDGRQEIVFGTELGVIYVISEQGKLI